MEVDARDIQALLHDKYDGDTSVDITTDVARLEAGEPLAYVIGWIPFLGLHVDLSSRPLIPRSETEWWTEALVNHLKETFGDTSFSFLDLCAGSGAIGLSVLKIFPNAQVYFGEIEPRHAAQIEANVLLNELDRTRAHICESDLFEAFAGQQFNIIATNPPYVPTARVLPLSVADFEPPRALYAGGDGLALIRTIAEQADAHLTEGGELWLECDSEHAHMAASLFSPPAAIHEDQYGRPRFLVHTKD